MSTAYVIKDRRGRYFCGNNAWSGNLGDAARWRTIRAASRVVNRLIDMAEVCPIGPKAMPYSEPEPGPR